MIVKPEVRYNFTRSNNDFDYNTWMFLIVSTNPQIKEINKRINEQLNPIVNEVHHSFANGQYSKSNLNYLLREFDSSIIQDFLDVRIYFCIILEILDYLIGKLLRIVWRFIFRNYMND